MPFIALRCTRLSGKFEDYGPPLLGRPNPSTFMSRTLIRAFSPFEIYNYPDIRQTPPARGPLWS